MAAAVSLSSAHYGRRLLGAAVPPPHSVKFYEQPPLLAAAIADYFEAGLRRGEACLAVIRPNHWDDVRRLLAERGCDPSRVHVVDAAETLARFMVFETPDRALFRATIEPVLDSLGGHGIRAFGEMVDLLCRAGNAPGAIALEGLWNALRAERPFSLLCGYCLSSFANDGERESFERICDDHSHVIPVDDLFAEDDDARMREITVLQQRARALEAEVRERQRVEAELRAALRLRDEFLSLASHELRTPLAAVQLQAQMISAATPDDRRAARMVRSVGRLTTLVDQLFDVTRITNEQLKLERGEAELGSIVRDVVGHLEEEIERSGCTVSVVADPVTGVWDRVRIGQVVFNLLGNALKYGARSAVDISVCARADKAVLSIRDHGMGIARADQARIFERFERAASVEHYAGLGLGLWITRKLVIAHGGTIAVDSEPNRGATFTVELPTQ
jgi:signal transduction histidine kinase